MSSVPCASRKKRMTDVGEGAGQSLDSLPLSAIEMELGSSRRPTGEAAPGPPKPPPGGPAFLQTSSPLSEVSKHRKCVRWSLTFPTWRFFRSVEI